MLRFSPHALKEMKRNDVSEDDVRRCLEEGKLVTRQMVKGEMRYGNQLALKDKKIVVIYTYENEDTKVITCYPVRRKKWWKE